MKFLVLFRSIGIAFVMMNSSCAETKPIDTKPYYFPFEGYANPVVYHYADTDGDTTLWEMSYDLLEKLFITEVIQGSGYVEITKEKISEEGARIIDYQTYVNPDSEVKTDIMEDEVILWSMDETDSVTWSTTTHFDTYKSTIRKTRSLSDQSKGVLFDGKEYDAIVFKDKYEALFEFEGKPDETDEFVQKTVYANGIGIVSYTRTFTDGSEKKWELIRIDGYTPPTPE